jgi:5-methylcytosine-specific restriction endonuclease McrA
VADARQKVIERDRGTCRLCRLDCQGLDARAQALSHALYMPLNRAFFMRDTLANSRPAVVMEAFDDLWGRLRALPEPTRRAVCDGRTCLEVDHVVPLALGGSGRVANQRVLCVSCHKRQTARLAALLARLRPHDLHLAA